MRVFVVMRRIAPALLLLPLMGFQCEYFSQVVVPATDSYPPVAATRYWIDGNEQLGLGWVEEVVHEDVWITVAPAAWDSGGVQFLSVGQTVRIECHDDDADPELTQVSGEFFFDLTASQGGTVGSTVSDGLFVIGGVTDLGLPGSLCVPGFDLVSVEYEWTIWAVDFHGNVVDDGGGRITYAP